MAKSSKAEEIKQKHYEEFRRDAALERFQERQPQLWMQFQRVHKLADIQGELEGERFPEGSCFLHANLVGCHSFAVKRVTGVDLDTCQVSLEIYGDDELEEGVVVLPLETIEWFGFPAKAVPVGVHFQGFAVTGGAVVKPPSTPGAKAEDAAPPPTA